MSLPANLVLQVVWIKVNLNHRLVEAEAEDLLYQNNRSLEGDALRAEQQDYIGQFEFGSDLNDSDGLVQTPTEINGDRWVYLHGINAGENSGYTEHQHGGAGLR